MKNLSKSGKILVWGWNWSEKLADYWKILTWIFIKKKTILNFQFEILKVVIATDVFIIWKILSE